MAFNKYSAEIESYFSGELTGADRILFEGKVESNPELKELFEHQQEIVESLRTQRATELKARLNNISVEPSFIGALLGNSIVQNVGYGVTGVMLTIGAYMFFNQRSAIEFHVQSLKAKTEYILPAEVKPHFYPTLDYRAVQPKQLQISDFVVATSPALKKKERVEVESIQSEEVAIAAYAFEVPEIASHSQEDALQGLDVDIETMDKVDQVTQVSSFEKVNIQTINSRKYNFHYRLEDNRLFLYGKFNMSPYEIIEITSLGEKRLYFFYQDEFYQLHKSASVITELAKIENESLISELNLLKDNE